MNRRTRGLAAGVAALSAGAILVGPITALAQSDEPDDPTTTTEPEEPDAPDAPDPSSWLQEVLAPLVESGTLTQAQADAVIEALRDARPAFGDKGGPHWRRGPGRAYVGHSLSTAAEAIGISDDDLRAALEDGETIAEVAEANGVAVQDVIDALVAEATERLDEAVADGDIDQAEADERLADITERITEFVNEGTLPGRPGGPGGPWGEHRADDDSDEDADEDVPSTTEGD